MRKNLKDGDFPNVHIWEFLDKHGIGQGISYSLGYALQNYVRNPYGSFSVTSGYRCPECNASAGGDPNSAHLDGSAGDFYLDSGALQDENFRKKLVTELRKSYLVHFCYCEVGDDHHHIWDGYTIQYVKSVYMGSCIHIDTYPIYTFTMSDTTENSVKVCFLPDKDEFDYAMYSLDDEQYQNLNIDNVIRNLEPSATYKLKLKLRFKGSNDWVETETLEFTTRDTQIVDIPKETQDEPFKEAEPIESTNIPDNTETTQNEPQKQEVEHNMVEPNKKKTILSVILQFFKYIVQLFKGGK